MVKKAEKLRGATLIDFKISITAAAFSTLGVASVFRLYPQTE